MDDWELVCHRNPVVVPVSLARRCIVRECDIKDEGSGEFGNMRCLIIVMRCGFDGDGGFGTERVACLVFDGFR